MTRAALGIAAIFASAIAAYAQPVRDARRATESGTAVVSGIVTGATDPAVPLRRARVTLSNAELNVHRTIVTDETGTFSFAGIPAGRFGLAATKEGFVELAYGARQPGRPGTSVVVTEGAHVSGLAIRLPRGAVITGVVIDPVGQPMPGVQVSAMQHAYVNGERRLIQRGSSHSDDRGVYRIFGLRAGQYLVQASLSRGMTMQTGDLLLPSAADIDRVLQASATVPDAGATPAAVDSIGVGKATALAPVYYPGGTSSTQATPIDIAPGQERGGIDLQLRLVPSGRIEGTVSWAGGDLPPMVQVTMVPTGMDEGSPAEGFRFGRALGGGKFHFGSVSPGQYVVAARANEPGGKPGSALWATANVGVDGTDLATVALELGRGFEISGQLQFEAERTRPSDVRGWRVSLAPAAAAGQVTLGASPAEVEADGTFTIRGVTPGQYFVNVSPPTPAVNDWMVRSIRLADRDVGEQPMAINGDVSGVVVTFTDRVSQISGRLQLASGVPAPDYHIIVFPADPALWTSRPSPRIQAVRPSLDGSYIVRRLPPGDYLLVGMLDVETGEWSDPAVLRRIAPSGMRVTIAEGERKVQDLQIGK